jgi:hypothetical protein
MVIRWEVTVTHLVSKLHSFYTTRKFIALFTLFIIVSYAEPLEMRIISPYIFYVQF